MAWPCQLTIGSSLTIRIVGYKAVSSQQITIKTVDVFFCDLALYCVVSRKVTEEKVKKSWTIVDAQSHQRDDVKRETVYCLNDDDETEVQKDDTIQGAEQRLKMSHSL